MNTAKLNVSRIDKTALFEGKNGKYLDIVLFDKPDQYGNDGFVAQDIPKERRDAGERGPIIGNWKRVEKRGGASQSETASSPAGNADMAGDDIPFSPFCKQSKLPL